MSTPGYSPLPALGAPGAGIARLRAQFGPFALILAVHVLVLYGIYSGLLHRVVHGAAPAAVFVSLIAPSQPAPSPPPALSPLVDLLALPPAIMPPPTVLTIAPPVSAINAISAISVAAPLAAATEQSAPAAVLATAPAMAAQAAPAPPAGPRTLTSGVQYLLAPQPEYPALSKRMGEQGRVVLRILVDEKGVPEQVLVQHSSGFARLDEAARQAMLRALFKPHLDDGRALAVYVIVPLNFQLGN